MPGACNSDATMKFVLQLHYLSS